MALRMTTERVSEDFYIFNKEANEFVPVGGSPVEFPGYEEFDLFIHRATPKGGDWVLSEGQTGHSICTASSEKKLRITALEKFMGGESPARIQRTIDMILDPFWHEGRPTLSPRYRQISLDEVAPAPSETAAPVENSPAGTTDEPVRKPRKAKVTPALLPAPVEEPVSQPEPDPAPIIEEVTAPEEVIWPVAERRAPWTEAELDDLRRLVAIHGPYQATKRFPQTHPGRTEQGTMYQYINKVKDRQ